VYKKTDYQVETGKWFCSWVGHY